MSGSRCPVNARAGDWATACARPICQSGAGGGGLFGAEEGVAEEEEDAENPDEGADFAAAAAAEFDEGEGEEAEAEAGGDAEGERSGDEGEEGGEGFAEIVPLDAGYGAAHEGAD